ncbi:hypothetical protein UFOVP59_82 [uncultured Caudovirales phage]|uniref:Uncharacterized protein n=1 Tax=uncultured Caudovirales phage TaxID=2100421 RepID=A0A6J5KVP1_9CAUD|nr:hypothetical protein UFOVP59_82 [uncultured Caudovirales phage]CAB5220752.1 hypothetical protein UFOVP246_33 [uncultured Caudovirales phage]
MTDLADIVIRVDTSQLNLAAGATEELRRGTLNLIGSVDRVAAAQISHANAMRVLRTAVSAGILSQQELARTTASLTQRLEAQGLTLNNLGQVVQRNTGIFRRFGSSGMQQVGYQVGDFAVQVQSGTNALVALGQQGTQLLGIFGPAGAIAGAFFAIGTALLNVYFQTQKFKQAADNLKTGISELRAEIKLLQSGAMGVAEEFGKVTTGLERTVRLVATVTLAKALGDARTQLAALTKDIYTSTAPIMTSTLLDQRYQETQRYKRDLGMGGVQATQMADMELALARAKTDKERLGILNQMNAEIEKQVVSGAIISDEGLKYVQSIALAQQGLQTVVNLQGQLAEASKVQVETEKHKSDAIAITKDILDAQNEAQRMLNGGLSVAGGLHNAAAMSLQEQLRLEREKEKSEKTSAEYAEYLRQVFHMLAGETSSISVGMKELPPTLDKAAIAAYKLAAAMADTRTAASAVLSSMIQMDAARTKKQGQVQAVAAGFVGMPEVDNVASRAAVNAARSAILEKNNAPEKGTKGPSTDTIENKLQELYKYLDAQKQIEAYMIADEEIAYQQREDLLKSALDKKLITLQDYQSMEVDLTTRHQQQLKAIESTRLQAQLSDASNFFGAMANIAESGGKKSAKAVATFQAIEGTVNAYGAALKALNTPGITIWGRFAAYASVLAAGLKGVAAIRSAGGIGGGGSSGVGSVGTSAQADSAAPQQVLIQGLKPTDIFSGEQLSTLFDSLYKENRNRGMVFMVQR